MSARRVSIGWSLAGRHLRLRAVERRLPLAVCFIAATALRVSLAFSAQDLDALHERFRFHAGAPLLAPAGVAADGSVCIGTADGYVHLLGSDGSFRWSHSVHGAVTQRPVRAGALWLVSTSAERIYALTSDGTLYWVFKPLSAPVSELAVDDTGTAYFVAADHFFYGVSAHGAVLVRAPFGDGQAGPCADASGAVWAENGAGNLLRAHGREIARSGPEARPALDLETCDAGRDARGNVWRAGANGALELARPGAERAEAYVVASAALLAPVWSEALGAVVVSARDGLVLVLSPPPQREAR